MHDGPSTRRVSVRREDFSFSLLGRKAMEAETDLGPSYKTYGKVPR